MVRWMIAEVISLEWTDDRRLSHKRIIFIFNFHFCMLSVILFTFVTVAVYEAMLSSTYLFIQLRKFVRVIIVLNRVCSIVHTKSISVTVVISVTLSVLTSSRGRWRSSRNSRTLFDFQEPAYETMWKHRQSVYEIYTSPLLLFACNALPWLTANFQLRQRCNS